MNLDPEFKQSGSMVPGAWSRKHIALTDPGPSPMPIRKPKSKFGKLKMAFHQRIVKFELLLSDGNQNV